MRIFEASPVHSRGAYDRFAKTYESEANEAFYRDIAGLLRPGVEVRGEALDLGCGCGFSTQELMRLAPQARRTAIDSSALLLERAQARNPGPIRWVHGRAEALPFRSGQFAWVASSLSYHWFGSGAEREVRRVLAPGGRLSLAVPLLDPRCRQNGNRMLRGWVWSVRDQVLRRRSQGLSWEQVGTLFPGWIVQEKKEVFRVEAFADARRLQQTLHSRGAWNAVFGDLPVSPPIEPQPMPTPLEFSWRIGIVHLEVPRPLG